MAGLQCCDSATRRAGEAVEYAFDAVEMALLDIAADLEAISEHGCTNAVVHHAELLAQIREVLHLRGLAGGHTRGAASPAKDVAQDLAEHVAARRLRCRRRGSRLSSWRRHRSALTARQGERSAFDDHGLDAPLAKALLQFAQDVSEKVAARSRLTARARRHRRRDLLRTHRGAGRRRRSASENLAQNVAKPAKP